MRPVLLLKRDRETERRLNFEQSIKESRRILEQMKEATDARKREMDRIRRDIYGEEQPS